MFVTVRLQDSEEWDRLGSRPPYVRFGGYDYRLLPRVLEEAPIYDDLKDRIAYRNISELIRQYNLDWQLPDGPPQAPRVYQADELWAVDPEKLDRLTVYG